MPKSGCLAISSAGSADDDDRDRQVAPGPPLQRRRVVQVLAERDDGQQLHQLRRLDVERPEVEPAPAAAHHLAEQEHAEQQRDARAVEDVGVAADGPVVERGDAQEHGRAQPQPGDLLREQVRLAIVDRAPQVDEAQRRHRRRRQRQRPVEAEAQLRRQPPSLRRLHHGGASSVAGGAGRLARIGRRVSTVPARQADVRRLAIGRARRSRSSCATISIATGAATSPPWPPCSTSTATAIRGRPAGAKPTNQAWSSGLVAAELGRGRPCTCAVPVLPATSIVLRARLVRRPLDLVDDADQRLADDRQGLGRDRSSRRTRGANSSSVCPSGDSTRSTICGSHSLPPLAMAAYISAICSSVTRVEPCPMTAFSACPIWNPSALGFWRFCSRYHSSVGQEAAVLAVEAEARSARPAPGRRRTSPAGPSCRGARPARRSRRCSSARWRRRG